jgi:NADH-quinone oxidoreductase subunit K
MFFYLLTTLALFILSICGVFLSHKNIILILMSIELMLLSINLNFILFSIYLVDLTGFFFSFLVLTIAAAESAIGLSFLVSYHRFFNR